MANLELQDAGHINDAFEDSEKPSDAASVKSTNPETPENDSEQDSRPTWGGGLEFLMSCITMSVGLGNIWRFPFTAYENGGGAFLIPYIIVLFLVGKPMYYMEMVLGQFSNRNNIRVWVINPGFKGTGLGQLLATASIVSYYVSLMAITLFYLIQSFKAELPWAVCQEEWGDICIPANSDQPLDGNTTLRSSSELYFLREVVKELDSIDDGIGAPEWRLTLYLLASWVVIFLVIIRGVKSSGKASYFLALFPYVVMIALLIRAVTLPGAGTGILYFITPQWEELYNPKVWYAATTQVFFSLGVCLGPILIFATYNKFSSNVYRDAMIVTTLDTFTSLLSGFTIFGILGNLAYRLETDVSTVVGSGGTGLAFISYPHAIAQFEWVPQLFAVLFFLMLFVLGLGTAVSLHSVIVTVLADKFQSRTYWQLALVTCVAGFLIGLVYVTPGGQFIFTLVDKFGATFLVLGMAIAEIIGIYWFYGLESFCNDIEFMTGRKMSVYWRWCWGIVTPLIMIFVFLYAFINNEPLKHGEKDMPPAAHAAGWTLLAIGLIQVPIWMIVAYFQNQKNLRKTFSATEKWGPKSKSTKDSWIDYKEEAKRSHDAYRNSKFKHILYSLNGSYKKV